MPFFNASCPGKVDVHADTGGPIYIGGKQAKLKRFNENYYEARLGNITVSVTVSPDGSPDISYTGKGGANGVCQVKTKGVTDDATQDQGMPEQRPLRNTNAVAMGSLPAFCKGEASAAFGRRPTEITTNMAFRSGNRIVVQGYYPDGEGQKFFNCWFDPDGNFVSVN
ncbi:hypothetical protein R6X40_31335 [Rhizobium sp. PL01]|nr:hypothetical protein [Rhizobium sp. PL01]